MIDRKLERAFDTYILSLSYDVSRSFVFLYSFVFCIASINLLNPKPRILRTNNAWKYLSAGKFNAALEEIDVARLR